MKKKTHMWIQTKIVFAASLPSTQHYGV